MPARLIVKNRRNKYGNRRTVVDGIVFASKKEAERWGQLCLLQDCGEIKGLGAHVPIPLYGKDGSCVGNYVADFTYSKGDDWIVEDVKSKPTLTPLYKLKKRLLKAQGIVVQET